METKYEVSKIPVFIGVTGHREIRDTEEDREKIKKAVKAAVNDIMGKCKYTDFILLTSLAAGADQLAAEAITEMADEPERRKKSIRFGVILPMKKEDYFTRIGKKGLDFNDDQRKKAEVLMRSKHCAFVYELPDQDISAVKGSITQDDLQFREAARLISDSSFAGIALWDGKLDSRNPAGTGPTVRDFLHGKSYHRDYFPRITIPETRPIYHIYTPKEGTKPCEKIDYCTRRLFPEPLLETGENWFTLNGLDNEEIAKRFKKGWHKPEAKREESIKEHLVAIERFNKDAEKNAQYISEKGYSINIKNKDWKSISAFDDQDVDDDGMFLKAEPRAQLCEKYYKAADALAMKYQKMRKRGIWWMVWIAGIAYIFLNTFSDLMANPYFLAAYLVLLLVALFVNSIINKSAYHSRFVDYRTLSEGLRVQYFWFAADVVGEDRQPARAQDYYLRRQKGQIEWIRSAIRAINLIAVTNCKDIQKTKLNELKKISDLWLGRMDERVEDDGVVEWYNPTYRLKDNGQVGYFLSTSLKKKGQVLLKKREKPSDDASKKEKDAFKEQVKKEALCLSEKFKIYTLLNTLTTVFIAGSLIIALVLAICLFAIPQNAVIEKYSGLAMFVAGLLPVVAMVLREICGQMGYEEDVNRYAWYYNAFKRAVIEIDEVYNDKDIQRSTDDKEKEIRLILFQIGKEALIENADWVMLNAKRVPEVPTN